MADLADMIQKAAFYQAGGQDPGTTNADRFNQGADIVTKVIGNVLAIKKARYENQKTQAETKHLGAQTAELTPTPMSAYMKPAAPAGTAGIDGNPVAQPRAPQIDYSKMSLKDMDTMSQANLRNAQADYYKSGNKGGKKLYVDLKTREVSETPLPGYVEVSANTGATIGAGPAKEVPLQVQREQSNQDRKTAMLGTIMDKFNARGPVVKAQSSIDAANSVIDLIDSNNPLADNAVPTYMARASGEVGNLSEPDKAPFGGSQALAARMQQAISQASTGQLTPENRDFVRKLAQTMKNSAIRNQANHAKLFAKQYGRIGGYGTEAEIYSIVSPDSDSPVGGGNTNADPLGIR